MRTSQNAKPNTKKESLIREKIAILSVLKPVDDVRSYQKIAKSILKDTDKTKEITLIGFEASTSLDKKNTPPDINFIELFTSKKNQNRVGFWRFFAGFKILASLISLPPTTIIVCAVELLPFTLFFKLFYKKQVRIIYDVQENYVFNILYQDNYPFVVKQLLAFGIRYFEKLSSYFIDLYLLAEKCYLEEMPFLKDKKYIFLENKFLKDTNSPILGTSTFLEKKEIQFLIYGSFSKVYGTLEGILFFKKLEKELQKRGFVATLVLAGYCSDKDYTSKILESIKEEKSILVVTDCISKPIFHQVLVEELQKSDCVILPYLSNKSTQNCIPTKFYECLAYQKIMLISPNLVWENFITPLNAGIFIDFETDFEKQQIQILVEKILYRKFYTTSIDETVWKFDREIIRKVI